MPAYAIVAERSSAQFHHPFPRKQGGPLPSHSILIVDDHATTRSFMMRGLWDLGYQCQEAANGLDALIRLQTGHYDVILTNLQMPFVDGLALSQHIKEDASLGSPMIIMMTSTSSALIESLAYGFGIREILSKPCLPCEVDRIIRSERLKLPSAA